MMIILEDLVEQLTPYFYNVHLVDKNVVVEGRNWRDYKEGSRVYEDTAFIKLNGRILWLLLDNGFYQEEVDIADPGYIDNVINILRKHIR